jgi:hypothetical protein
MTYREWEVPTPANERISTHGMRPGEYRDLFSIDAEKKKK